MSWPLSGPSRIISHDEILTVLREGTSVPGNVVYVDGKPIKRNSTKYQITCNVQPLNGRELLLVPELDRYKEQYWVYTNKKQSPVLVQDQINRNGAFFHVQEVQDWGSYSRARIMRVDTGPNANP